MEGITIICFENLETQSMHYMFRLDQNKKILLNAIIENIWIKQTLFEFDFLFQIYCEGLKTLASLKAVPIIYPKLFLLQRSASIMASIAAALTASSEA